MTPAPLHLIHADDTPRVAGRAASPTVTPFESAEIAQLQQHHRYPAVSILMPRGMSPDGDRARLARLTREATSRLRSEFSRRDTQPFLDKLNTLCAAAVEADLSHQAVAVFAGNDVATTVLLPIPVRERVVIDATFATRDLVHALHRSPKYRVLVLSERSTCLYAGCGAALAEVTGTAAVSAELNPDARGERSRLGRDRSALRDTRLRRYVRDVDAAFARHLVDAELPLILVGANRRVNAFRDHSRYHALVTDVVVGGFDRKSPRELSERVWPCMADVLATRRRAAIHELDAATGAHRAAFGIDKIWRLANEGRGALLIVEENYEFPARISLDTGDLEAAKDVTHPDVVDDAVDEVIEIVLAKGGRVAIVADDALADRGRIAMALRH